MRDTPRAGLAPVRYLPGARPASAVAGDAPDGTTSDGLDDARLETGPTNDRVTTDGPATDGPASDGPATDGPAIGRVGSDGVTDDGPANNGVTDDGVTNERIAEPILFPGRTARAGRAADDEGNDPEVVDRAIVEQRVLRALSRKALSEVEVRALIAENGLEGDEAEELVARLIDLRYVDDRVLAEELRRRLSETKGQSKGAVARGLSARGLPSDVVAEVVAEIDDDSERAVARELAEKRLRQLNGYDSATLERRLTGFLARRGYPGGVVRDVVSEVLARRSSGSSGPRFR